MASTSGAIYGALVALIFWTAVGYPVARRIVPPSLAPAFAPLAGWAIHSVVALPVFFVLPFSRIGIATLALVVFAVTWAMARHGAARDFDLADEQAVSGGPLRVSRWAWAAATLLAILCAWAILPKPVGDAVMLSDQIFDHAKVSMINEMTRLGLPPSNPFFANDGSSGRLSYYYLLHFSAAELSHLIGISGWEADVAMTFFAVFTSLTVMMGMAVRYSGRASASIWVVALAATSSSRIVWLWVFGGPRLDPVLPEPGGLAGWLFQSAWVPQHLISTSCVLLAVLTLTRMSKRPGTLSMIASAALIAAAFQSSTWVGGIVFALSALFVVPLLIVKAKPSQRVAFIGVLAGTAIVTLLLVLPFLRDQIAAAAVRNNGFPIVVRVYETLGEAFSDPMRKLLDLPAYWVLFLPVLLPATYLTGLFVLIGSWLGRGPAMARTTAVYALGAVTLVGLAISCLLVSTFADNNDLGWRAALLSAAALIVFSAIGLSTWMAERRRIAAGLAVLALVIGLPEGYLQIRRNLEGNARPEGMAFARGPDLWRHVRDHAGIDERVASNPLALEHTTGWPVNIGWSLLADRRSCYAGWELTQVFTAVPHDALRRIDTQFIRVFKGEAEPDDVKDLATTFQCRVAVVTPEDGAWNHDPFEGSAYYKLVEGNDRWRIYRVRS